MVKLRSFAIAQHDESGKLMPKEDKKLFEQRIALIDSQINDAVYKLYRLTEPEIKVLEWK
ncbi:hypothetical protein J5690_01945 [bacterium]|nr:hypothetical protein [bacterium]